MEAEAIVRLLEMRARVPDQVLLDCLELDRHLGPMLGGPDPLRISTARLRLLWHCSQPAVSRRMSALRRWRLADITPGGRGGAWVVRRIGPPPAGTPVPLINQIDCGATDLAL